MSRLDRFLGLDDDVERRKRAPLWKRAVWHAVKNLVRKHPGAAMSAAGAGAGYAVKQGVEEGADAVKETVEGGIETIKDKVEDASAKPAPDNSSRGTHGSHHFHELSSAEKKELVESLSAEDRKALAELAGRRKPSTPPLRVPAFRFRFNFQTAIISSSSSFRGALTRDRHYNVQVGYSRLGWREPGIDTPGGGYGFPGITPAAPP